MNGRFPFSARQAPLRARLQRYGLLLAAALLLLLVLLPVIGLALFALLWLLIGVAAGAFILFYVRKGRKSPRRP